LVADGELGPDLCPVWPAAWDGAKIEAHGLVTPWGSVSFAVRWHGGRPALLWEIEPPPGLAPETTAPRVRASGLDPNWQGTGWSGEGLLAGSSGVEGASPGLPGEGDSFT
jgi:hypothetical protein